MAIYASVIQTKLQLFLKKMNPHQDVAAEVIHTKSIVMKDMSVIMKIIIMMVMSVVITEKLKKSYTEAH